MAKPKDSDLVRRTGWGYAALNVKANREPPMRVNLKQGTLLRNVLQLIRRIFGVSVACHSFHLSGPARTLFRVAAEEAVHAIGGQPFGAGPENGKRSQAADTPKCFAR